MYRFIFINLVLICAIISCQKKDLIFKENTGKFAELEVKVVRKDSYYLSVHFNNDTSDTLGIICIGNVRQKEHSKTELGRILYDTIIEIKQGTSEIKSTDVEFSHVNISERIHQLLLIKPQSEIIFSIFYRGNIVEDFNLNDSSFYIRIILEPQFKNLERYLSESESGYLKSHKNVKLIKEKIITPFIKINP